MSAVLRTRFAGPHVSVQDGGRAGFMRFGVPHSGPMDRVAFQAANLALGNPPDHAGIEVSIGGLVLDCLSGETGYAIAGGGFATRLSGVDQDGRDQVSWHRGVLRAGQNLQIRPGPWGSWCYLALAGNLDVPRWLGSASTHSLSGFGGGRLIAGRQVTLHDTRLVTPARIPCPVWARPSGLAHLVMGPQQDCFAAAVLTQLVSQSFRLTPAYDRMGLRLSGPDLSPDGALDIPSGPVAKGSIQVAGDGIATVLLADHQTTGGYPRIATIIDADLDALVQMRPHDPLRFQALSAQQACAKARTKRLAVTRYLDRLSQGDQG